MNVSKYDKDGLTVFLGLTVIKGWVDGEFGDTKG